MEIFYVRVVLVSYQIIIDMAYENEFRRKYLSKNYV